jgi:hypothetical protein
MKHPNANEVIPVTAKFSGSLKCMDFMSSD